MSIDIKISFKVIDITCESCQVLYSVILHTSTGNYWIHQSPPYCPYCGDRRKK